MFIMYVCYVFFSSHVCLIGSTYIYYYEYFPYLFTFIYLFIFSNYSNGAFHIDNKYSVLFLSKKNNLYFYIITNYTFIS